MFIKKSYIGSNLPSSLWSKLKKKAHDVWDMSAEGNSVMALRKKQDTAKASNEGETPQNNDVLQDYFQNGDIVLLFMGGRKLSAKVASVNGDRLALETDDGILENIPTDWVKRA